MQSIQLLAVREHRWLAYHSIGPGSLVLPGAVVLHLSLPGHGAIGEVPTVRLPCAVDHLAPAMTLREEEDTCINVRAV